VDEPPVVEGILNDPCAISVELVGYGRSIVAPAATACFTVSSTSGT
jgi:hypothetical protein